MIQAKEGNELPGSESVESMAGWQELETDALWSVVESQQRLLNSQQTLLESIEARLGSLEGKVSG
jgi:hypothetical protein